MNCEQARNLMHASIDGQLNPHEIQKLNEHIDTCEECTVEYEEIKYMVQLMGEVDLKELPLGFEEELHNKLVMASNEMIIEKNTQGYEIRRSLQGDLKKEVSTNSLSLKMKLLKWMHKFKLSPRTLSLASIPLVLLLVVFVTKDFWLKTDKAVGEDSMAYRTESVGAFTEEESMVSLDEAKAAPQEKMPTVTFNSANAYGAEATESVSIQATESVEPESNYREGRLIIKTANLYMDVEKYDEVLVTIKNFVNDANGYIESESTGFSYYYSESDHLKSGSLTIRIPEAGYQPILDQIKSLGLVTSDSSSAEDITKMYRDTASEIENLKVTETRLREIMAQATTVTDILTIENELTRIRGNINGYEQQLKNWESLVDMTTIYLQLNEVKHLQPIVEPIDDDLFSKAKEGFIHTINQIKLFIESMIIWIVSNSPVLLIVGILGILTRIVYKRKFKKGGNKDEK